MEPKEDLKIDADWLKTLYSEAWAQYIHEDNMSQSRNTLFLSVQTVMLLTITTAAGLLIDIGSIRTSIFILGLIICILAPFGFFITIAWGNANEAGRAYLNMRWAAIRAIETAIEISGDFHPINLAGFEGEWSKYSRDEQEELFFT